MSHEPIFLSFLLQTVLHFGSQASAIFGLTPGGRGGTVRGAGGLVKASVQEKPFLFSLQPPKGLQYVLQTYPRCIRANSNQEDKATEKPHNSY